MSEANLFASFLVMRLGKLHGSLASVLAMIMATSVVSRKQFKTLCKYIQYNHSLRHKLYQSK